MRTTVKDVMTTQVVAVQGNATFHEVARLIIDRGVSGMPVLDEDGKVVGVVSEADLLHKEEFKERYYREGYRPALSARLRHHLGSEGDTRRKAAATTAAELMTSPPYVTTPDSPVVLAARIMDRHGVKRLPVVDAEGRLAGIVSRRDLIRVFVRSDEDLQARVREDVLKRALGLTTNLVEIGVTEGVVTLVGEVPRRSEAIAAGRLTENLDGVVAVVNELRYVEDDTVAESLPVWGGA
ncbi:CBS domain-containing protein [Thermopolyspora sp. NPDC052614]|uniref:CBS domain-containing protein n=1 Tax=Thermopolyspora sp. NPDC052614 TaxID=3155682 RepID=UPI00342D1097